MKFKFRPLVLTMVLVVVLGFLVANFLAVPSLAADANCKDGGCSCKCSGSWCACASGGGACMCECDGKIKDICLPFIM